jgi:hypothetical protein
MRRAAAKSATAAITRIHYAASIILRAHITNDQYDDARRRARDGVVEASRGLRVANFGNEIIFMLNGGSARQSECKSPFCANRATAIRNCIVTSTG